MAHWDEDDRQAASRAGWAVDLGPGAIRAVEGGIHADDARAQAFVASLAIGGDPLARRAWSLLNEGSERTGALGFHPPVRDPAAFRLCQVEGAIEDPSRIAFFTTRAVEEQWGDDWDDAPYEHNAGRPYHHWVEAAGPHWEIAALRFRSTFLAPRDVSGGLNSPYAVAGINVGEVPWLTPDPISSGRGARPIMAGAPMDWFARAILEAGGHVEAHVED